ncbi:DUF5412 domain-containing protein [Radiobacillus sp. PE A8.2]|uniref:DUF5412 domain-containing protein n=1 Tax=Radiobacillus sp. PE A8.2 TaxID=3380349 RepID=UPI00388D30C7
MHEDKQIELEIKNTKRKVLRFFGIMTLLVVEAITYGVYWLFFDMDRLPEGEFLTEETSPNGDYTLKAYVVNGGATTAYSVRAELVFHNKDSKTKNVYWNYREEAAIIKWKDEDTVFINGHELDVPNEKYDFRRSS